MHVSQGDHMIARAIIKTVRGFDRNRKPHNICHPGYPEALTPELLKDCPSRVARAPDSPLLHLPRRLLEDAEV